MLSSTATCAPWRSSSARTTADPIKPAPPVTMTFTRSLLRPCEVTRQVPQARMLLVLVDQNRSLRGDRPADAEVGIVPQQTQIARRIVMRVNFVLHQSVVRQRAKAVRETARHQQLLAVIRRQLDG